MMDTKFNLSQINSKDILVIGDIMIDRYYKGETSRISPEAPVPVLLYKNQKDILGGAANVAANLTAAKQNVSLMSIIGNDKDGKILKNMLEEIGVNTDFLFEEEDRKTTVKTRFQGQNNHQMLRLDVEDKFNILESTQNKYIEMLESRVKKYDIVLISDYQKGLLNKEFLKQIIDICNNNNVKTIVDVKSKDLALYKNVWMLKPNLLELQGLSSMSISNDKEIEDSSEFVREKTNAKYVLTTRGGDGMTLVGKNIKKHFKCMSKQVFDVTGAGDTVLSYLAIGISNNLSMDESIDLANFAAGVKVSHVGTYAVTLEDVANYIDVNFELDYDNKIVDINKIEDVMKNYKDKKIVFTNGCYDVFHLGHASYLKEASKFGDILVVGVNSDSSVKRLKGESRPINNQYDRAELLSYLPFVDYIVIFEEDTPYNLIEKVNPLYIVKGGDYKIEDVVGRDIAEKNGGEVKIIPLVPGKSSTSVIEKISNKRSENNE